MSQFSPHQPPAAPNTGTMFPAHGGVANDLATTLFSQQPAPAYPQHQHASGAPMPGYPQSTVYGQPYAGAPQPHGGLPQHSLMHQGVSHHLPVMPHQVAPSPTAVAAVHPTPEPRYRVRLRWENILPLLTTVALIVAGTLFISAKPFSEGSPPASSTSSAPRQRASSPASSTSTMSGSEVAAKLQRVQSLINAGQYAEAGMILQAMSELKQQYPMISQLTLKLNANESLNTRLQRQLGRNVATGNWRSVRATLRQIASLHPLSADQQRLMAQSQTEIAKRSAKGASSDQPPTSHNVSGGGSAPHHARRRMNPMPDTSSGSDSPPPTSSSAAGAPPNPPPAAGQGTPGSVF